MIIVTDKIKETLCDLSLLDKLNIEKYSSAFRFERVHCLNQYLSQYEWGCENTPAIIAESASSSRIQLKYQLVNCPVFELFCSEKSRKTNYYEFEKLIVDILDYAAINYGKIVNNSQEALNYYFELDLGTEKLENVICSKSSAVKFKNVVTNIIINETIKDDVVYFLPEKEFTGIIDLHSDYVFWTDKIEKFAKKEISFALFNTKVVVKMEVKE